ncbi:hypothetical protein M885DRAFT_548772 [Pelagophyceae sp. CCMP2097]|nr:hypothetical protein M885DRAFT_548772 [Pelagophyceae sp. CCMP2097]
MAPRLLRIVLGVFKSFGSGFADPRLTGILADPHGKGDVFRSESRLDLYMSRLYYMERWRLCLNAKNATLDAGIHLDP